MLLIPCPHCGPRDEVEFTYGGPLRALPEMTGKPDAEDWHKALYEQPTLPGLLTELWYHASGCECWVEVTRDTRTHELSDCGPPRRNGGRK